MRDAGGHSSCQIWRKNNKGKREQVEKVKGKSWKNRNSRERGKERRNCPEGRCIFLKNVCTHLVHFTENLTKRFYLGRSYRSYVFTFKTNIVCFSTFNFDNLHAVLESIYFPGNCIQNRLKAFSVGTWKWLTQNNDAVHIRPAQLQKLLVPTQEVISGMFP